MTFGPAGRDLPLLPLYVDCERLPAREGQLRRAGRAVVVGRPHVEGAAVTASRGAPLTRRTVRWLDQRTATAPYLRKALRYLFPDHWSFLLGEVALYAFVVLVGDGDLPDVLLRRLDEGGRLPRHVLPAALRPEDERGVRVGRAPLARLARRPPDPADAPLGGERLHRGDRAPPLPRLLHGRLPEAARADVLARRDDAHALAVRGVPRLLARRRPHVGDGPRDRLLGRALAPVRRARTS